MLTMEDREQIKAALQAYKAWRMTPVVDDDFPEMFERLDLEMARLARLLKSC
jgi:hypothetical protein